MQAQLKAANDSVADAIAEEQIPVVDAPVADVLDVVFNADGTAEDVSPMHNEVGTHAGDGLVTYYNNTYGKYVARFDNTWAGAATGWYSIDFRNNERFWNKLADRTHARNRVYGRLRRRRACSRRGKMVRFSTKAAVQDSW